MFPLGEISREKRDCFVDYYKVSHRSDNRLRNISNWRYLLLNSFTNFEKVRLTVFYCRITSKLLYDKKKLQRRTRLLLTVFNIETDFIPYVYKKVKTVNNKLK